MEIGQPRQAATCHCGLRLAESAGYNLREAFDAVVEGRSPVSGGLPAILEAWGRYQAEAERAASLRVLEDVLDIGLAITQLSCSGAL
jgi:hypothetical protein